MVKLNGRGEILMDLDAKQGVTKLLIGASPLKRGGLQ